MTDAIVIELYGEPIAKGRPRFSRKSGFAYTPAHTRKYESALRYAAQQAMGTRALFDGPVKLSVTAMLPVPASWSKKKQRAALAQEVWPVSRPDGDNYLKAALDSLNEIVFRDDSQVVDMRAVKRYSDKPKLSILVESI